MNANNVRTVSDTAISLQHVGRHFDFQDRETLVVLQDITFEVKSGEFVSIVGPSGCGKSTILNLVSGLLPLSEGNIKVLSDGGPRSLGYIFQKDVLFPWRTVLENVCLPLKFRKVDKETASQKATEWIRRVGLQGFEYYYPAQLSGGMRKRVALAMVFIYEPATILMDEPFGALDIQTRNVMENELLQLWEENKKTVVFVTHDLEEAISLSDRVLVMKRGPGRIKSTYEIDLPRPRNVVDIRFHRHFLDLHQRIWNDLKEEVLDEKKTPPVG